MKYIAIRKSTLYQIYTMEPSRSHSSKVQGLDSGFSRAFQVEWLDPGFLSGIHKHQAKILRFFIGCIFPMVFVWFQ
jgi:hypothetical protein